MASMLVCFFPVKRLRTKYNVTNALKLTPSIIRRDSVDQILCSRMNWSVTANRSLMLNLFLAVTKFKLMLNRARARIALRNQNSDRSCQTQQLILECQANQPDPEVQDLDAEIIRLQKIEDGKKLLDQRLSYRRLQIVDTVGDGNCQFRAISAELFGTETHHQEIRTVAVAWLAEHGATYSGFIGEEDDWTEYLTRMLAPGTWGDELTLRAVSEAYGVAVHVVTSERDYFNIVYEPKEARAPYRHAFLAYVSPIHYNSVQIKEE